MQINVENVPLELGMKRDSETKIMDALLVEIFAVKNSTNMQIANKCSGFWAQST